MYRTTIGWEVKYRLSIVRFELYFAASGGEIQ